MKFQKKRKSFISYTENNQEQLLKKVHEQKKTRQVIRTMQGKSYKSRDFPKCREYRGKRETAIPITFQSIKLAHKGNRRRDKIAE